MKKYGKVLLSAILALVLMVGSLFPAYGAETDPLTLESKSAVLMDGATGTVLYEKNSHEAMPPASVTKVMTLLLIYEAEEAGQFKWEDGVQVSEHAAGMGGSQVFLEEGNNPPTNTIVFTDCTVEDGKQDLDYPEGITQVSYR